MSRYLTPSKIGLLALISLYTESIVPSAATIPVLSFLVFHILLVNPRLSPAESSFRQRELVMTIGALQKATISHGSGIPGRTLWDLLLDKMWKINSFDALHVFFDNLDMLLQKSLEEQQSMSENAIETNPNRLLLSRASPAGSFVRRAQIEFTRLQFHDGVTLWKSFIAYRAPTLPQWKKRNPAAGGISFDSNLQEDLLSLGDPLTNHVYGECDEDARRAASVSTQDIEKLLEYQKEQMQSMFASCVALPSID